MRLAVVASEKPLTALPSVVYLANCPVHKGHQTISRLIPVQPREAIRPACKVHGATVVAVQVALTVRPSPAATEGFKHII